MRNFRLITTSALVGGLIDQSRAMLRKIALRACDGAERRGLAVLLNPPDRTEDQRTIAHREAGGVAIQAGECGGGAV